MHSVASAVKFSALLGSSEAVARGDRLELNRRSRQVKEPIWSACSVYGRSKPAASFPAISSEHDAAKQMTKSAASFEMKPDMLKEAYDQCGRAFAEENSSFYLGTLLIAPETRKSIWAIEEWGRRIDKIVDGPSASSSITYSALDDWESRLEDIFAGHPHDMLDVALLDTVTKYQVDIQLLKDMLRGMRMDLEKSRYNTFDELYDYCYCVAGTIGLMCVHVMGMALEPEATAESLHNSALALGTAFQLTNILRDVGEDARRGRIYLPQDELAQAGISDDDIFDGEVTDKWREFMKQQIAWARMYYDEAEKGIRYLNHASKWPVYAASLLYRNLLDEIEANDYDSFTKRATVGTAKKLIVLFTAFQKLLFGPSSGN